MSDFDSELTERQMKDEIKRLHAVIDAVHSWIVCAAIATPEDMMQSAQFIMELTTPGEATIKPLEAWSMFNSSAEVASGLSYAEALANLTEERLKRGWTAVCVINQDNFKPL